MNVKFTCTTSDKLSNILIHNGQLIYVTDSQEVYQDFNSARRKYTDVYFVNSIDGITGITGKLYVVISNSGKADAYVWNASTSTFVAISSPIATESVPGLVKPDGTTITIDSNGTISAVGGQASSVTYDNTVSGLAATNVQTAVDEVAALGSTLSAGVSDLNTRLELLESLMPWKGTRAQWDALSSDEKSKYKIINIIDE